MHSELAAMFGLSGRVALVTGGASNLGHDAAAVLASAGCDVIVTSRSIERAKSAAARIARTYGVQTLPLALDHTDSAQVQDVVSRAARWQGHLDILVNNAGNGPTSGMGLFDRRPQDVADMVAANLTGPLSCCREAAQVMVEQGNGKIINIASIAGMIGRDRRMYERHGMAGQPVDYGAAKGGVIAMTRDLAAMLSPKGIYVNAISPGGFARKQSPSGFVAEYADRTPLGHMGRDGIDLKGAVVFLASAASDYVTGHNLVVDGGFSIWR